MGFWERNRKYVIPVGVALLLCAAIVVSANQNEATAFGRVVSKTLYPFQVVTTGVNSFVRNCVQNIHSMINLKTENEALQEQLEELNGVKIKLRELERENSSLRKQLGYVETHLEWELQLAKVIGRDPSSWLHMIVVNKGQDDGIEVGMSVLAVQGEQAGLVGRVTETNDHSSKVLLIIDPEKSNATAAQVEGQAVAVDGQEEQETWHQGVIEGSNNLQGMLEMMYIHHEAEVKDSGMVVSTGIGGNYVANIPIGIVQRVSVEEYGLLKRAVIKPILNFNDLFEVLIVKSPLPYRLQEGPAS